MVKTKGIFIISFDFELYWGVRDKKSLESYRVNLLGVRRVVPTLLTLFEKYRIHATWTIVGFLFFKTREALLRNLPDKKPAYVKTELSPYEHLKTIGVNEDADPFHFGSSLVKMIAETPHQEIGSHTFSHYYCLEKGQDADTFKADMCAMKKITKEYGLDVESLSFPRNQFNPAYVAICKEMGVTSYRGNEPSWIYQARSGEKESLFRRAFRLADAYINLSGHHCYSLEKIKLEKPFNIPSSRFLRPYIDRLKFAEAWRLQRILSSLTYAAKKGLVYHLWWHPHNFGINLEENVSFLTKILDHYIKLQKLYGMESLSMREISVKLTKGLDHEK